MDNRSPIQRSISMILVGMIALFAASSLGNIHSFVDKYHHGWSTWPLAAGFAVTVFICAYLASTAKRRETRMWSLAVGGIFGLASGIFQISLYIDGGAHVLVAVLLSFVPIVVGEVGLALVESSYSHENMLTEADRERAEVERLNALIAQMNSEHDAAMNGQREHLERVQDEHREHLERWEDERQTLEGQLQTLRDQLARIAENMTANEQPKTPAKRKAQAPKPAQTAKVDPNVVHRYFVENPHASSRKAAQDLGISLGSVAKYKPALNGVNGHG